MKKTLVAIAALSAFGAFAQSSVTVFGTIDPSFRSSTIVAGGVSSSQAFLGNNGQGTSQVSFRGVEDLGGGLKATFMVENDFNSTNQSGVNGTGNVVALGSGGGEVYVGLEGGFGKFYMGSPNTPSLIVQASRNNMGTKLGSGFGTTSTSGAQHVRDNGSLVYWSPDFSGFSASLAYVPEVNAFETANPSPISGTVGLASPLATGAAKTDLGLFYNNGPIAAGLSFWNQAAIQTQTNFAFSYAFGPAKVFVGFVNQDIGTGAALVTSSGANIALNYSVTPTLDLYFNMGNLNNKTAANSDRKISALGAKYSLSKRTSVYAKYVAEVNDGAGVTIGTTAGVTDVKTFLVGVQHNF